MAEVRYWLGVTFIAFSGGAVLYWFSIHPLRNLWRRAGARTTVALHLIAMAAIAIVVFRNHDHVMIGDLGWSVALTILAIVLFASSAVLRYYHMRQMDNATLMGLPELDPQRYAPRLRVDGVYAYIRHPRYVQLLLAMSAYVLFVNYLTGYLALAAIVVLLMGVVALEERELLDRFGDEYRDYKKRVPSFLPRWR